VAASGAALARREIVKTLGEHLQNPDSNVSRQVAKAQETMKRNAAEVERLVAQGLTTEQAWAQLLFGKRS
jgi:hypothetical protein